MTDLEVLGAYRNQRVLVTGHTGFKGAWLTAWLRRAGARVLGLSLNPPSTPYLFEEARLDTNGVTSRRGDIRDSAFVCDAVQEFEPDVLFHLAAQPIVHTGVEDPIGTISTNVLGTANVLSAALEVKTLGAVVVITTDKCYLNLGPGHRAYRENDQLGGRDPYSASKAAAEMVTSAYRETYFAGRGLATARAGNVIGGGDWARDRLLPDLARATSKGAPLRLRDADGIRPWQHVLEPLFGYLTLGVRLLEDPGRFSGAWNFGPSPDSVAHVAELVDVFRATWAGGLEMTPASKSWKEESFLLLDSTKASKELGWRSLVGYAEAVQRTAFWYRDYYGRRASAAELVTHELDWYEDILKRGADQR